MRNRDNNGPKISWDNSSDREFDPPINPKRPMIDPNTSTIRILTKSWGSAASASAAFEPVTPTVIPQSKLQKPTVSPPQKSAKPCNVLVSQSV